MSDLTLEKMRVSERLQKVEGVIVELDGSVKEIKSVLFGERGEKGVVSKLEELISLGGQIKGALGWIVRLAFGTLFLAALPSMTSFLNTITHIK